MTDDPNPIPGAELDRNMRGADGLTILQRRFCDRYLELLGEPDPKGIKKRAAIEAGYAESDAPTAAWKNLRHPACVAYMAGSMTAAVAKVPVDRSYVLWRAMQSVERAEAKGQEMAVLRGLELIARHVDVAALVGMHGGLTPPGDGAGPMMAVDLSGYSTDEKRLLLDLLTRTGTSATSGLAGSAAPIDRRGRSEGEAGPA